MYNMIHIYNNQSNTIKLTLNESNTSLISNDYVLNIKSIQNRKEYSQTLFSTANTSTISFYQEYPFQLTLDKGQYTFEVLDNNSNVIEKGYLNVHDDETDVTKTSYEVQINSVAYDPTK